MKRAEQVEGVKRVMQINDHAKQTKMVKILVDKLFVVSIIGFKSWNSNGNICFLLTSVESQQI